MKGTPPPCATCPLAASGLHLSHSNPAPPPRFARRLTVAQTRSPSLHFERLAVCASASPHSSPPVSRFASPSSLIVWPRKSCALQSSGVAGCVFLWQSCGNGLPPQVFRSPLFVWASNYLVFPPPWVIGLITLPSEVPIEDFRSLGETQPLSLSRERKPPTPLLRRLLVVSVFCGH